MLRASVVIDAIVDVDKAATCEDWRPVTCAEVNSFSWLALRLLTTVVERLDTSSDVKLTTSSEVSAFT